MGSSQEAMQDRSSMPFEMRQWQIDDEMSTTYLGNFITLRNIHTKQMIDQYELFFSSQEDYYNYLESFRWRQKDTHIVRTYHYYTKERGDFCSSLYSIIVYICHPKVRLSDFRDIPYPDSLYCMMAMLEGYRKIFEKIGKFYLAEEQVCIDDEGEIRVWVNSDLSKNYPEAHSSDNVNSLLDEEEQMVEEIFQMVLDNADPTDEPDMKFKDFFYRERKSRKLTFEEGKLIVHDYASCHHQRIPSVLQAVMDLFDEDSGKGSVFCRKGHDEDLENGLGNFTLPQALPENNVQVPQHLSKVHPHHPLKLFNVPAPSKIPMAQRANIIHHPPLFYPPQETRIMHIPPNYPRQVYYSPPPMPTPFQPQYFQNVPPLQYYPPPQKSLPPSPKHNNQSLNYQFSPQPFHSSDVSYKKNNIKKDFPIFGFRSQNKEDKNEKFFSQRSNDGNSEVDQQQVMRDLLELKKNQENFQASNPMKQSASLSQNPFNPFNESAASAANKKNSTIPSSRPENPLSPKKSLYYTLEEQKELDPEIAADLLLYT